MGPAGSGKGTMSERIIQTYKVPHISTGDMFRQAMKDGTELGLIAKTYIDEGKLVPDELTISMVKERLQNPDCQRGYLLDGYPRTLNQAHVFEEIAASIGKPIEVVLNLVMDFDKLAKRITGRRLCKNCGKIYHIVSFPPKVENVCDDCNGPLFQRSDDTVEQLRVRIDEHERNTNPVLRYYASEGLVANVDASKSASEVWANIKTILESKR